MQIQSMHDKNNGFRLVGYRIIAENWDEERVLNLNEWLVEREHFGPETAIHLMLDKRPQANPKTK